MQQPFTDMRAIENFEDYRALVGAVIEEEPIEAAHAAVESHAVEPEIIQSQEPQPKPKRKRYYPQVGEPTLRVNSNGTVALTSESNTRGMTKVMMYVLAVIVFAAAAVTLFSMIGIAVFFLPLLAGAFK